MTLLTSFSLRIGVKARKISPTRSGGSPQIIGSKQPGRSAQKLKDNFYIFDALE